MSGGSTNQNEPQEVEIQQVIQRAFYKMDPRKNICDLLSCQGIQPGKVQIDRTKKID